MGRARGDAYRIAGSIVSMTHYLSVIQRAVDSLETNTVESRAELYDRARRMLRERFSPATASQGRVGVAQ
jgi:hypothetical protein